MPLLFPRKKESSSLANSPNGTKRKRVIIKFLAFRFRSFIIIFQYDHENSGTSIRYKLITIFNII